MIDRRSTWLVFHAVSLAVLFAPIYGFAQDSGRGRPFPTPAEQAEYLSFTPADEVLPYLSSLVDAAGGFQLDTLIVLNRGNGDAVPLPVARIPVSSPLGETPAVRVLILGSQHGTERAGLEVALRMIRDLVEVGIKMAREESISTLIM